MAEVAVASLGFFEVVKREKGQPADLKSPNVLEDFPHNLPPLAV
jgi:hypothetical protein